MSNLNKKIDKLIGGIQIQSKKKNGIGTLASIVFDKNTNKPLGLTNRHILKKRRGFSVIQPAVKPRTSEYIIGSILRKGGQGRYNDFAVFELDLGNRDYDKENSIYGLSGRIKESVEPVEGMKVQKVGQRTGHTFGIIKEVKGKTVTIVPNTQKDTGTEISRGGDSGALWVTDEKEFKAVALHRVGEPEKSQAEDVAFAIPINHVLNSLNIKF